LRINAEVFAFGQKLADELVGVFVDAALPGRVRVGKVDFDSGTGSNVPPTPRQGRHEPLMGRFLGMRGKNNS
jgi:hypothetical protein